MSRIVTTVLQPASGGFGEWDWVEGFRVDDTDDLEVYLDYLRDEHGGIVLGEDDLTEEALERLSFDPDFDDADDMLYDLDIRGSIHDERDAVVLFVDEDGLVYYNMVWET